MGMTPSGYVRSFAFEDCPAIRIFARRQEIRPRIPVAVTEVQTLYSPKQAKLPDRRPAALRARHYGHRTEKAYVTWIKSLIFFHHGCHPAQMVEPEINDFLTHLEIQKKVSTSIQNQALSALRFHYRHVLGCQVGDLGEVIRARKPQRLPVIMIRDDVKAMLENLSGARCLMALLMYGAGLRACAAP